MLHCELPRQHQSMSSDDSMRSRVRRGAIAAVALAAAVASVIAATGVANGAAAQQRQGFGAAARVAVGQAAAKLATAPAILAADRDATRTGADLGSPR